MRAATRKVPALGLTVLALAALSLARAQGHAAAAAEIGPCQAGNLP
jgi:hypothetical protein